MIRRALIVLALALVAGGCGLGAGEEREGGATITVTRDFGLREVGEAEQDPIRGGETVMRMLQREFEVETRYGGGFVQSINGIAGGRAEGRPVDWFYFVNGVLAEDGAAAHALQPGDRIWWDHRDWGETPDVRAVVGAFPEPFLSGSEGKKLPVRIDCAAGADEVCDEVAERLEQAGVKVGGSTSVGSAGGAELLRVTVGTLAAIGRDPAVGLLKAGPRESGVFARPSESGAEIELLDPTGAVERTLGAGAGLVAATRVESEAPTWLVTGTDAVGLAAAAAQLHEEALANRYAIAVEEGRTVALPIQPEPVAP